LRGALVSLHDHAAVHDARRKVAPNQPKNSFVVDPLGEPIHEYVVTDPIKGNRDTLPIPKTFPNRSPSSARATLSRVAPCGF